MNGIIVNDKQYIFVEGNGCDECDFRDMACSAVCDDMLDITGASYKGVFKELKKEK